MRTRRDALFVVIAFLMGIFLPALSNIVNPANWHDPVALEFYRMPLFWIGLVMIVVSLALLFIWTRKLDDKIDGFDKDARKQLKNSIQTLNKKLDKLDKLDKIDKLVEKLNEYIQAQRGE